MPNYLETSEIAIFLMQAPSQEHAYYLPTRSEQNPWSDFMQVAYNCFQMDMI